MEFIDPKLKQRRSKRLKIGYALLTLLVGLATYILVMTAKGYQILQSDGQVVQNGIIFLDSKPVSADIFINGKKEDSKTEMRLTVPESEYEITLKAEGYKDWTKRITLEGGRVLFINYPRLLPSNLISNDLKAYSGDGNGFFTQSPDRKWILLQPDSSNSEINVIDTSQINQPQNVTIMPPEVFGANGGKLGKIEVVEWSSDNVHFLVKHTGVDGVINFAILNREDFSKSININKLFNIQPTKVSLIGSKIDRVYLYLADGGLLRTGDVKSKTLSDKIIDQVLDFKTINDKILMYATTKNSTNGKVSIKATDENKIIPIGEVDFDPSGVYLMDAGQFAGDWYYATGSNAQQRVLIYKNPQNFTESTKDKTPNVLLSIRSTPPIKMSFSAQKRFILVQGTDFFNTYDTDTKNLYKTPLVNTDGLSYLSWIDEFMVQYYKDGKLWLTEFDGKNTREITESKYGTVGYLSGNHERLYTLKLVNGITVSQLTNLTIKD